MKKLLGLMLTLMLLVSLSVATAENANLTALLDGMTLEELEALKLDIEGRISAKKAEAGANDPNNTGMWELRYYVDEFRMPTDTAYIVNTNWITGTFSNSATTNSLLNVKFLIDEEDLSIMLYEYGNNQVKNAYSSRTAYYDVTMLDNNGTKHYLEGYIFSNGDRIFFDETDEAIILEALKANGTVRFAIVETERASNSYVFAIEDTSYFSNAYELLFK